MSSISSTAENMVLTDDQGRKGVVFKAARDLRPTKDTVNVRVNGLPELWKSDGRGGYHQEVFLPVSPTSSAVTVATKKRLRDEEAIEVARVQRLRQKHEHNRKREQFRQMSRGLSQTRFMQCLALAKRIYEASDAEEKEAKEAKEAKVPAVARVREVVDVEDPTQAYLWDDKAAEEKRLKEAKEAQEREDQAARKQARLNIANSLKDLSLRFEDWKVPDFEGWLLLSDVRYAVVRRMTEAGLTAAKLESATMISLGLLGFSEEESLKILRVRPRIANDQDGCLLCAKFRATYHATAPTCCKPENPHNTLCLVCASRGQVEGCMQCTAKAETWETFD
jgi:hypothetical protein